MDKAKLDALIAQFVEAWGFGHAAENAEFEQALREFAAKCGQPSPVMSDDSAVAEYLPGRRKIILHD